MKLGLALGGGAARGIAHIPLLEALDELGVKPSRIAGTSIGALVGAAYASGMSGKDLRAHVSALLANRIEFMKHVFGARKMKPTDFLSLKSLTSLQLNAERLADIALPDWMPLHIEDTKIPLRIVACNYDTREEVVFEKGPLLRALGASIAIPGALAGPTIDGDLFVDGGVVNPVPFDHAREDMDIVVAIDVTGRTKSSHETKSLSNIEVAVGSLMLMYSEIAKLRRALNPPDIYITPPVQHIGSADFFNTAALLAAGDACKDELKRKITLRLG